jgi:hypothetical protein
VLGQLGEKRAKLRRRCGQTFGRRTDSLNPRATGAHDSFGVGQPGRKQTNRSRLQNLKHCRDD